jgi:lipopolysaccharide export system permease protein
MRLLDRYLLREVLTPLVYCLTGFFICLVGADWFREQGSLEGMKFGEVIAYYAVKTPALMVNVMPIALLLGLLYALSHHARNNEITAIRAAGVSLWRLSLPYFSIGLTASVMVFVMNEWWVPDGDARAEDIKERHKRVNQPEKWRGQVQDFGFSNEREGRSWLIEVYDISKAEMLNPQVISMMPDGSQVWLKAGRAVYQEQRWVFYDAEEHLARTNALPIPILRTNVLARPKFTETPDAIRSEIKIASRLGRRAREADLPLTEVFDYLRFHPQLKPNEAAWIYTHLHGRLAMPWTCLVVVLIALPFGAPSGRRNAFVGVASSIFIVLAFLVLTRVGLALGTGGHLPPWVAGWLPNIVFSTAGLWLTARVR